MSLGARLERTRSAVERAVADASTADDLLESLSATMHDAVPHSGSLWFGVDPATLLATAPSRVEGLDPSLCDMFWHLEFHEQDTALYADLARGDGVSAMRLALDDRPNRSIRYRDFLQPQGYEDELRNVFRAGDSAWGVVGLFRDGHHDPFDADDIEVVRSVSTTIAEALRGHVRELSPWLGQPSAPGLLVVDHTGRIVSANQESQSWLRELWPTYCGATSNEAPVDIFGLRDHEMQVPTALHALVQRARAVGAGRERTPARLRLRDRRGRWLVLHASTLSGPEATDQAVAVVIEAAKSAEIAPIVIEAYSLTQRERDVLGAIARGGSTAEIATELFLSPHTVRDHVKTVFEKVGVSSRGELVARLFGEHYADRFHDTMSHD